MRQRVLATALLAVFVTACGGDGKVTEPRVPARLTGLSAIGTDPTTGASIETDLDDYAPGGTVNLTGRGWAPNETVRLVMTEDPDRHADVEREVQADDAGTFTLRFYEVQEGDMGVRFTLTGTGSTSGSTVVVQFTDQRNISAILLTPASPFAPATSVSATVEVLLNTGGGGPTTWLGTKWEIRNSSNGVEATSPLPCLNTNDHEANDPDELPGNKHRESFSFTAGAAGTYSLTVSVYSTDNCASSSDATSLTIPFTVNGPTTAATTTSVVSSTNPSVTGQGVTFTATVKVGATAVTTGTVTFKIGGTDCSSATTIIASDVAVDGSGQATSSSRAFNATENGAIVRACYGGATGFGASENSVAQAVNAAVTTTTLSDSPTATSVGQPVTFTPSVNVTSPGAGTPTGAVRLYELTGGQTCAAPGTLLGSGTSGSGIVVTGLSAGTHTITACYEGDANFSPSSGTDSHTVGLNATSTALSSSVNPTVTGQSTTFTATVTDINNVAVTTGSVTFKVGGTSCTDANATAFSGPTAVTSGQATASASYLASQSPKTIRACYGANATYDASENFVTQTINKGPTTTTLASTPDSPTTFGQSVTFTATVAVGAPASGSPTGTVSFYKSGTCATPGAVIAASVLLSGAQASTSTSLLDAGAYTILACYSGDNDFSASPGTLSFTVNRAATSLALALTAGTNPSEPGASVTFTATVSSTAGTPTGTVSFSDGGSCNTTTGAITGGTSLGSGALTSGKATLTTTTLSQGIHTIVACYGQTTNYIGSTNSLSHTVKVTPVVTVTVLTTTPQYSDKATLRASLSPNVLGSNELEGTVTFYVASGIENCTSPSSAAVGTDGIVGEDDGVAEVTYQVANAGGGYKVTACFVPAVGSVFTKSAGNVDMTVAKENATFVGVTFNGSIPVSQTSFDVTFGVQELRISNVEPDPNDGAEPGDISKVDGITAKITGISSNASLTTSCAPGTGGSASYASIRTFKCTFTAATGFTVDAYTLTLDIPATNGYWQALTFEDALSVWDPGAGFATGGGTFSLGGDRVSFGFSYTQTKGKTAARSGFVVVRHLANGGVCRVKSNNQMNAPAVVDNKVTLSGKGNYNCTDATGSTAASAGNINISAYAEDNATSGAGADRFWVSNAAVIASHTNLLAMAGPASDQEKNQLLTGGNVQVPQPQR